MKISSRSHLDPTRIPVGSPVEIEVSLPHLWLPVQPGLICASVRWSLAEELLLLRSVGPIWGIAKEIVLGAAKVRTMCQWIGISGYLLQCSKRVLHLGVLASKLGQLGAGVHHPPSLGTMIIKWYMVIQCHTVIPRKAGDATGVTGDPQLPAWPLNTSERKKQVHKRVLVVPTQPWFPGRIILGVIKIY